MYHLYLCGVELPEETEILTIKIDGKNKTQDLLNGKTITFQKSPGLNVLDLSIKLPMFGAKRNASYYTEKFKKFFKNKKQTQFIVTRTTPDNKPLDETNIKVAIWNYSETESADAPFEMTVNMSLKEYVDYGTETTVLKSIVSGGKEKLVAIVTKEREKSNAPSVSSYKVAKGDTLFSIAAKYMGSSSKYKELFKANKDVLIDPSILKAGIVLKVPK